MHVATRDMVVAQEEEELCWRGCARNHRDDEEADTGVGDRYDQ